jgi:hypothetical protein
LLLASFILPLASFVLLAPPPVIWPISSSAYKNKGDRSPDDFPGKWYPKSKSLP